MGISLNGLTPAGTYPGLIKTGDNTAISGTPKVLSDGNGNNLPMEVSTTGVNLTGSPTVNAVAIANTTQVAAKQDTLVSGTNIKTINGASLLGSGNIPVVTSPSGVSGAIQFSNGSAFASDAANLFWDDTNNRLGIGTNAPTSPLQVVGTITTQNLLTSGVIYGGSFWLQENGILALGQQSAGAGKLTIKGSGSTSATTSLLVQNSAGASAFTLRDDLSGIFAGIIDFQNNVNLRGANFTQSTLNMRFVVPGANKTFLINADYGDTNAPSAMLEVQSTTKGFLPPRMTTTQKNAIASPAAGLVVYDSTTNKLQCYNGSTWNDLF